MSTSDRRIPRPPSAASALCIASLATLLGVARDAGAQSMLPADMSQAAPNDLALNRLSYYNSAPGGSTPGFVFQGGCGTAGTGYAQCLPDNQLWFNLVNQLGGALAPSLMAPASTLGYNGVSLSYEQSFTNIDSSSGSAWHRGTNGGSSNAIVPEGSGGFQRDRVPNVLTVPRIHVRKAFPFGFELGLQAAWLADSNMYTLGLDIRWALFEGFRHGGLGFLPDFAVRGSVNTLVGNSQMYLTIVGVDVSISKQFTLAGMMSLTPFVGAQALFIFGDSGVIDGTPDRSGYTECTRRHTEFSTDAMGQQVSTLVCDSSVGNTPAMGANDSLNEMVFTPARILRGRGFGGLRFRFGIFTLTAEFAFDAIDPQFLNTSNVAGQGRPTPTGTAQDPTIDPFHQWTTTVGVGVTFF